jgi:hypothetical protein
MSAAPTPQLAAAIAEIKAMVLAHYSDATFDVSPGEDPVGTYLTATVDVEDSDEVFDVVVERLLEMQVDEHIPLYVLAVRPIERIIAELHAQPPG